MTLPAFLVGILISSLYGAAFHLWRNGGLRRLLLYLVLSWTGFWAGQLLATFLGWQFASYGPLNLGLATIGSVLFLFVGHWLSLIEVDRDS
ncbi:MAG: hypothetical protein R3335_14850 [Anaerolineales bacterium]|nr:hypothetical protein [Anaerolineales bacterium]